MSHYSSKLILAGLGAILWSTASQSAIIPCKSGTIDQGCSFIESDATGAFYDKIITATDLAFSDTFQVTLTTFGDVTITMTRTPDGMTFDTLTFDGEAFTVGVTGTTFARGPGTYDLVVSGTASQTGTFTGTIDFIQTIPEPQSWAMMIGGFALGGAMLRRQRRMQVLLA